MRMVPQIPCDFKMNETKLPTSLDKFMMCKDDGVFYIGHASALVRVNGKLFMFDPMWNHKPYGQYWNFFPSQVDCDSVLDKLSGIIISHIHEDHVCDEILHEVKCPIYIMDGRGTALEDRLDNPVLVKHSRWVTLPEDVQIMYIPHAFNSIDSSCFIRSRNFCVYVGSDNFLDARWNKFVGEVASPIDVAMVPYAFIHWYPRLMKMSPLAMSKEVVRLNLQSIQQAQQTIAALKPMYVVPFGNNLFYCDQDSILNRDIAEPSDLISVPIMSEALRTGGFILKVCREMCAPEYIVHHEEHKEDFPHFKPEPLNFNVDIHGWQIEDIRSRACKSKIKVPNHELIVNDVFIDLETFFVGLRFAPGTKPYTRFDFDRKEFDKWASGDITFEQAIGTRRFICERKPDVYNLQVFEFMNNYL